MAGSSVTMTSHFKLGHIKRLVFDCVADDTDGSFPAHAIADPIDGYLLAIETNPSGVTAPQANYDVTLIDAEGVDIMDGQGNNRHTATTEMATCVVDNYFHSPVKADGTYTLTIANNNVNDAETRIIIFYANA